MSEYTFDPVPLGMSSPYDTQYSPYQEGHTPAEASLDPIGFYTDAPDSYSASPLDSYQWWWEVSEARKQPKT